jgi:hypothetical protein
MILHQTKSVGDQLFFGFGGRREVKDFDVGGEGAAAGSAGGLVGGGLEEVDLDSAIFVIVEVDD